MVLNLLDNSNFRLKIGATPDGHLIREAKGPQKPRHQRFQNL